MASPDTPRCPYCREDAILLTGAQVYPKRPELASKWVWRCDRCDAHVGCHDSGKTVTAPDGSVKISDGTVPMGSLANAELRSARIEAHALFDPLWRTGRMTRTEAYVWLAQTLSIPFEQAHVAALDFDQCVAMMNGIEALTEDKGTERPAPDEALWLRKAGIAFDVADDGHLVVQAKNQVIDFWPTTQKWVIRGTLGEQSGLHELIRFSVL